MTEDNKPRRTSQHAQPKKKKKKYKIHWLRIFLTLFLVLAIIGCGTVAGVVLSVMKDVPSLDEAAFDNYAVTTYIMDKDGNYVDDLHAEENRVPVTYDEISPNAVHALIAIEDQRFETHKGIDPIRIAGAFIANLKAGHIVQGGSTITQQLVGLTLLDRNEKSYTRKLKEAILAVQMEREYSKEEIITHYLNRAYFGGTAYGIEAAAQYYYSKHAIDLTVPEAAMLVGCIQNPSKWSPLYYPENAVIRRNLVLEQMEEMGYISAADTIQYKATEIVLSETRTTAIENGGSGVQPYQSFVDNVIEEALVALNLEDNARALYTNGYIIYTTMDTKVQQTMEAVYKDDSNFPNTELQSAMVVTDPSTGAIRGLVGGRHQTASRELNRATQSFRQPGSSFKPIAAYGPAFEAGYGPASVIDDYPKMYGSHMFRNDNRSYRGLTTMRQGMISSINVVAVKTLETIGIENGYKFAKDLGFSKLGSKDMNLSMALGGLNIGVSPVEMAGAYGAFANEGVYIKPYAITKITDKNGKVIWEHKVEKQVAMSEETAYLVTDCLIDAVNGGTGTRAQISGRQVAGKTGTTSDSKDVWFTGYTKQYVGIVWMGYDTPKAVGGGGGSRCAPIFQKVMSTIHKDLPAEKFTRPAGVTSYTVDKKSGLAPSSLTPSEYITSDLFNKNYPPKGESTAWEEVLVDPLSGELFTTACPGVPEKRISLHRETPWQNEAIAGIVPADASLEITTECQLHTGGVRSDGNIFSLSGRTQMNTDGSIAAVQLSWPPFGDEDTSFIIHRSSTAGFTVSDANAIGSTTDKTYTDFAPLNGNNYYRIVAMDNVTFEQLAVSSEFAATLETANQDNQTTNTPDPDTTPEPPNQGNDNTTTTSSLNLSGSSSNGAISLSWNAPGSGQYQYYIFRSTSSGFSPNTNSQIGSESIITSTSFTDTTAAAGALYYYKVLAYDQTNSKVAESSQIAVQN